MMDSSVKATIKQEYQQHEKDTGSVEVQVALLSKRIQDLTGHLQTHKGDHNSRRGLIVMVSQSAAGCWTISATRPRPLPEAHRTPRPAPLVPRRAGIPAPLFAGGPRGRGRTSFLSLHRAASDSPRRASARTEV